MAREKMKPCPFCGGEEIAAWGSVEAWCDEGSAIDGAFVQCCECDAEGPRVTKWEVDEYAQKLAIRRWNERADVDDLWGDSPVNDAMRMTSEERTAVMEKCAEMFVDEYQQYKQKLEE